MLAMSQQLSVPDAEKEVRYRRWKVSIDRTAIPGLADALVDLAAALAAEGRPEEALTAAQEALTVCREHPRPELFLAEGLEALTRELTALDWPALAHAAAELAMVNYRGCVDPAHYVKRTGGLTPHGLKVMAARGLRRFGDWLADHGEHSLAGAAAQSLVAIWPQPAGPVPTSRDEVEHAAALSEFALRLARLDREQEALARSAEAAAYARARLAGGARPLGFPDRADCAAILERFAILRVGAGASGEQLAQAQLAARQSVFLTELGQPSGPVWVQDSARRAQLLASIEARSGLAAPAGGTAGWPSAAGTTVDVGLSSYVGGDWATARRLAVTLVESGVADLIREVVGLGPDAAEVWSIARDRTTGRVQVETLAAEQAAGVLGDLARLRADHPSPVRFGLVEADQWAVRQAQLQVSSALTAEQGSPPTTVPGPFGPVLVGGLAGERVRWHGEHPDREDEDWYADPRDVARMRADPRTAAIAAHYDLASRHHLVLTVR